MADNNKEWDFKEEKIEYDPENHNEVEYPLKREWVELPDIEEDYRAAEAFLEETEAILKQVKATLPLGPSEFKTLMTDKNTEFLIDLPGSTRLPSPKAQIAFLANANVPSRIDFSVEGMTNEFIEKFIVEWMNTNNIIDIKPIKNIVAKIILFAIGADDRAISVPEQIDRDFMIQFMTNHHELVGRWVLFLDSTYSVFMSEFLDITPEELESYEYTGIYPVIEDRDFIGKNVALLFSVINFGFTYFSHDIIDMNNRIFFKHQFLDYMWKNNHLSGYFNSPENTPIYMYAEMMDIVKEYESEKEAQDGQLPSE